MRPKILLLHGMGGTGALWRPLAASLEGEIDCLAPDQRGHGQSQDTPQNARFSPSDYASDLAQLLDQEKFQPTWVLGHSMGVRSACALAHLRPQAVAGLVLIDLGFSGPAGGGLGATLAQFLEILPPTFATRGLAQDFMNEHCPDSSIARYLMAVAQIHSVAGGTFTFPFDHQALMKTIEAASQDSVRPWLLDLAKSGLPIHVLRGETSAVWSQEDFENEREAFRTFTNAKFEVVTQTGHGLPFEKRSWLVEQLKTWLKVGPTSDAE